MNQLQLFLPCAAGVEGYLADEADRVIGVRGQTGRAGLMLSASWRDAMKLNLHTRLAQRVLVQLPHHPIAADWVTDILARQTVEEMPARVLDGQISTMADHHAAFFGFGFRVEFGQRDVRAGLKTLAATFLDGADAFDLAFGQPALGHRISAGSDRNFDSDRWRRR